MRALLSIDELTSGGVAVYIFKYLGIHKRSKIPASNTMYTGSNDRRRASFVCLVPMGNSEHIRRYFGNPLGT